MLVKIDEITQIGRFTVLRHKAPQLPRISLLFARNGFGKSTLCAVLRSATENEPNHISSRQRLGSPSTPSAKLTWSSGTAEFANGIWNGHVPRVHVFDQDYIQRNLHVGESVTRDNKRSLLPIVLGEQGVLLAQRIIALDAEQRESTAELKSLGSEIKKLHSSIENISSYCQVVIPSDIDARIEAASRSVELARQTVAVKEKAPLRRIESIGLDGFVAACRRTIHSASQDVAEVVMRHIERHHLGTAADRWLKFGVDRPSDNCPFCDQPIAGVKMVEALNAYYSDAFGELMADVAAATDSLTHVLKPETHWRVAVEANTADMEFWTSVAELPSRPTLTAEQQRLIEVGLGELDLRLRQKIQAPLAEMNILGDQSILAAFDAIEAYNQSIDQCNALIETTKQAVAFTDLRQAQIQQAKLTALGARRSDPMKALAASYLSVEAQGKRLAQEKFAAQQELTTYAPQTISSRQSSINALLKAFGTDFQVVDAKANFVGREPNTEFAIAIGNSKIAAGKQSETEPSFKTVLSSGDKVTLALSFFITQVRADPKLADAIVVFDDPFNSQDMGRQWETTSQVRSIAAQAGQVLVLSHDPRFLSMIERDAKGAVGTYQVQCKPNGEGAISVWSSSEELKGLYVRRAEIIREYANHGQLLSGQDEVSVQQALRPFLEDYIRARFPSRFKDPLKMLDAMIDEIEASGPTDPLFIHVPELRALNEYSRGAMHGGAHAPDSSALRAQCVRVIGIVGEY